MKKLKMFDDKIVSFEQLEELQESEHVTAVENCGNSGRHIGYIWYNVIFTDGEEISVYCK